MKMTLYEIDANIRSMLDSLYDSMDETGEIPEGDFEALEALNAARDAKIDNVACYIKEIDARAKARKAESDRLKKLADADSKKVERLKAYLTRSMVESGNLTFDSERNHITFRKSESASIPNESLIPKKWMVKNVEYKPDKKGILAFLKGGGKVKGATLETKQNIQIK